MSITIKDLLSKIFERAGLDLQESDVQMSLSASALSEIEVDEAILSKVNSGFLTLDSARNNIKIKNHFKGLHFGVIDNQLKKTARESGLSDDEYKELCDEYPDTAERIAPLQAKIKAKFDASTSGEESEKVKEYAEKINSLQSDLARVRKESDERVQSIVSKHKQEKIDGQIRSSLSSLQFMDGVDRDSMTRLITSEMKNDFHLKLGDDGAVKAFDKNNPELQVTDGENNVLDFKALLERKTSPFLKKSDGPKPGEKDKKPAEVKADDDKTKKYAGRGISAAEERLKEFRESQQQ